ncbi:MAG: hypothetical protein K5683_02770 [Prevotella sp.]|nr:hypothetical protein [Prevotella sp.]
MKKKNNSNQSRLVQTGVSGDYEQYALLPGEVFDSAGEAEVSIHYKHDTAGIFRQDDDDMIASVTIAKREYSYVSWGEDNLTPYHNMSLIEDNMIMSQCQQFNILTCYGQGVRFLDRQTKEKTEDPEIRRFCLMNAIHRQWLNMSADMKYNFFSVVVINLSRDHKHVVMMRTRQACDCRFSPKNQYGVSEYVLVGDWLKGEPGNVEPIPLLDEFNPLGDLEYRVGLAPHPYTSETLPPPPDGKDCKFAILCLMPTPGYRTYPIPYHYSIYRDYWYDIYRLIGIGKRHMIKNTSAPRIQVEIHRQFWDNVCREKGITNQKDRLKEIKRVRQEITDFCTKPENAGKAWITSYDMTPDGKEKRMVRINNLNEGQKKEGGDWSDDMQEASNSLCFAMGVHPNMVGAVPGKSQMNNSGSDKRELFTLKQALEKAFHDIMEVPFHVVMHFNRWSDKFAIDVPMIQLTTLDENKDAKEVKVDDNKSDDNGNNQSNS